MSLRMKKYFVSLNAGYLNSQDLQPEKSAMPPAGLFYKGNDPIL